MPRTTFRSETDGYAFGNSWMLDQSELDWVRKVVSDAVAAVEIVLSPIITAALGPVLAFELGVPGFGFLLAHETVKKANEAVVSAILDNTKDNTQGYCGGMAFSALDYFLKGWVIPRGKNEYDQPNDTTPSGAILRKYIWDRLMDSVRDNMGTFLQWTAVLHFSQGPGAAWLRDQTKAQLITLRSRIDSGMPVPLGLVGTTINPMHNHQVLCYGYDDHANGTTTLYLYDNNAPDTESTIKLDFTQPALHGDESCPKDERGPLRGLFCTVYSPHTPPKAVVLHSGLIISPPNGDSNKPMAVDFSAANIGYGKSLMLQLIAAADAGQLAVSAPSALEESQSLPFKSSLTFKSPGDHQVRALVKVINEQKNIETIKQLPPEGTSQTPIAHLKIFAPRNIRAVTQSGCEKTNIAGSKVTFVVNATDMGANPQFLWKVDGATIEGSANQRQIEVQLPATETTVTLQVTVSLPDGSFSMGSSSFLTILPLAAAIQQNLCEMGHRMIQPPYMYDFRNSEPFPEATTRITFQDLAAMHKVANSIVTSLTAAMRIEAPLTFAPGIRSILADQIVEGHAKAAGVGMNTPPVPGEV